MNRQGPSRPLQTPGNMSSQTTQPRHTSRLQQTTKPTIWSQQPTPQTRDSAASATESSWAQAMGGARPNPQLDLSSSAFPSLNNTSSQSQNFNAGSAWQTGPPQSEQPRRAPMQTLRPQASSRQQPGQSSDSFYPTDTFSRTAQNDFPMQDHTSQPNRRTSTAPSGPPGLVARPGQMSDGVSGDPSRVTSPSGLPHDSRSPLSNLNGAIGQDRPIGDGIASEKRRPDFLQQSSPGSSLPRDPFAGREAFDSSEQTLDSVFAGMSEKEKAGMKGYLALAEGPNPTLRSLMRGQDLAALGLNMNLDQPLISTYAGPFASPNTHPLRPLENDFTTPDCYTVKKVAPLHSRISSFTDETLFYIFYSMPRDYMQVLVGQELMERKWRYHMREQMWMMRDESSGQQYAYSEDRTSEQGYYIWWDKNLWKKVRRAYTLRYEDLDDLPSVGNRRQPAMSGMTTNGVNGGSGGGIFNAANPVPGLEKLAASGRGFS